MSVRLDPVLSLPHQPGVMLIHLLNRCNLLCQHCYVDAAPWRNTSLPPELAIRSIREAEALGIGAVYLSGGEPFLYPGLPEVLACASGEKGFEVYICTNGTLIGTTETALLKDTGAKVQVSIDGPEAYHDEVRGLTGAFRRAGWGIQQMVAAGVPVAVVSTICQDNLASLPWLAEWVVGMGVHRVILQPLLQLGRAVEIKERKLSEEQLCDLFLQLSDLAHTYRPQGLRFGLACRTRRLLADHPCAAYVCKGTGCHRKVAREIKKLVVREDGTVLPESPTLDDRFALGSLHEGTLTDLAARYFANGYAQFDRLCRTVYEEVMPTWTSPIIPWTEILSERSWLFDT